MHRDYYEAIVQLRPAKPIIMDFVYNQIRKNDIYVSKTIQHKNGIDIYVSSQKFAQQLLKKLKQSFKGTAKISRTVFTQNKFTSKSVYRLTVLFKAD